MKILFWTEKFLYHGGGVETFSRQLVAALQARGHTLTIITSGRPSPTGKPELTPYGPVWQFPFNTVLTERNLRQLPVINNQLTAIVQSFQPDLIHLNTTLPSVFFYLRNPLAVQCTTLLTLHMPFLLENKPDGLVSQVLNTVTQVVAVSHATLLSASRIAPGITERATVIYNALQDPPLAPAPLSCEPPVLLCVGRLAHQKGFDIALDAFPRVLARYPTAVIRIVGTGELYADLEQQAARLGIASAVHFVGVVNHHEVYHHLNQASLLLVPSRYEPFGLVALEAAQMARPVIASRVDGLGELVVAHKETGLLVEPERSDQLADAVLTLLGQPAISEQYGQQARHRAKRLFAFDKFVDTYDEVYQRLCC